MVKKISLLLVGILLLTLTLPAFASPVLEADLSETLETPERARERHELERERRERMETLNADADGGEAALMAGGATVSVTARLPGGVTGGAEDYDVYVDLYTPPEINASGRVTRQAAYFKRARATFAQGASATTVLFENVPAGKYIIEAYTGRMPGGQILNSSELYYNADGSMASSEYAVSAFSVSEGASVSKTIALPAPDATISGVLTFSSPLAQNTEFCLSCSGEGADRNYHHVYFTGKQGATSVPFSIGVASGCYALEFGGNGSYHYLNYDGTLLEDYDYRRNYYCNVGAGDSMGGLSINGDILLGGTQSAETVKVELAVTLPEALTGEREFSVSAVYQNSNYLSTRSFYKNVPAGQASFSGTLTLQKGKEYAFGYHDTTDCRSVYNPDSAKDMRYLAKDGGITTLYENAKKFRFTSDASVSIQEPPCGRVTGSVSRNGFNVGSDACAYAYALFPDGERYCARVLLGTADSAPFVICVPSSRNGQTFELSAVMARPASNYPMNESASESVSLTFNGNVSAGTLSVSGDYRNVTGTVSLPNGVKAPAGGQAVEIEAQYNGNRIYYVIPAGQNGVPFSFQSYQRENYGESLQASLEGRLPGVYPQVGQNQRFDNDASEAERVAWYQNRSLTFPASAVISGSVFFPSGTRDVGANMEIYAYSNELSVSAYSYLSILKGRASSAYAFTVPMGKLSSLYLEVRGSTDGRASDDTLRVKSDWSVSKDWGESPTVTGNRSGVNFTLDVFSDAAKPEIVSVSSDSYYEGEREGVLDGLRRNGRLYAVCAGPAGKEAAVIAAIYDEKGRFLDAAVQSYVDLRRSGYDVYLDFDSETASKAAKVRVCMLDRETYAPLTAPAAF